MSYSVFLINTPRQWVASHRIINQKNIKNVVLLIENNFSDASVFFRASESCYDHVFMIPGKFDYLGHSYLYAKLLRYTDWMRVKRSINRVFSLFPVSIVYSSNVNSPICQYIDNFFDVSNFVYVDDGVVSYYNRSNYFSLKKLISYKFSYGFWFNRPDFFCVSNKVYSAYLYYPFLANDSIKSIREVHKINADNFMTEFDFILNYFSLNKSVLGGVDFFILFDLFPVNSDSVYHDYRYLVQDLVGKGYSLAVKFHPREKLNNIKCFLGFCYIVPSSIPFELVLPFLKDNVVFIGGSSTAMLDAKLQLDNDFFYIYKNRHDLVVSSLFFKIGLSNLYSIQEICGFFSKKLALEN